MPRHETEKLTKEQLSGMLHEGADITDVIQKMPRLGRLGLVQSRILVTGSRDWDREDAIKAMLRKIWAQKAVKDNPPVLVHGGARGVDTMAANEWKRLGGEVEVHWPKWQKYGNRAGILRNEVMVDLGADICLAFIKNNSRGATHCANYAEKQGIRTLRIEDNDGG